MFFCQSRKQGEHEFSLIRSVMEGKANGSEQQLSDTPQLKKNVKNQAGRSNMMNVLWPQPPLL